MNVLFLCFAYIVNVDLSIIWTLRPLILGFFSRQPGIQLLRSMILRQYRTWMERYAASTFLFFKITRACQSMMLTVGSFAHTAGPSRRGLMHFTTEPSARYASRCRCVWFFGWGGKGPFSLCFPRRMVSSRHWPLHQCLHGRDRESLGYKPIQHCRDLLHHA